MRKPGLSIAALGLSVVGFAASVASAVDYLAPEPAFCAETGCATVRASWWSHPFGLPMPVLGVAFFATMVVLAFVERPRLRRALAIAGGAWAIGLIALQAFVIGAWCKLCLVVDPTAIALAGVVGAGASTMRLSRRSIAFAGAAMAATIALLVAWTRPDDEPVSSATTPVAQVAGETTIVEYVDFECPFCRDMQGKLAKAIERVGKPVHIVRKMVPLPVHKHAFIAAIAWCCADSFGKGDEMAEALFTADPTELTPQGCERMAARMGISVESFRAAIPAAQQRIEADLASSDTAGVAHLPTLEVNGQRVVGDSATIDQLAGLLSRT
jgi:uncharacterized membrane protein